MKNPANYTHRPMAVPPERFRNQATGIGQSRAASEETGARRSQRVIDCAPKDQERVADPSYPAPSPMYSADGRMRHKYTGVIVSPTTLSQSGR